MAFDNNKYMKGYKRTERGKEVQRKYLLKSRYGLSFEDRAIMLQKQDNKCAICQRSFVKSPCVDHDHKTGKIRSWLSTFIINESRQVS